MQKLYDRKEYTALFLYLAILYGFLEWQVPEKILLLPAVPDALKIFEGRFSGAFDERLRRKPQVNRPTRRPKLKICKTDRRGRLSGPASGESIY